MCKNEKERSFLIITDFSLVSLPQRLLYVINLVPGVIRFFGQQGKKPEDSGYEIVIVIGSSGDWGEVRADY